MTELKTFVVAIYDALSEAEMTALTHGQARRAQLREQGNLPSDLGVPVYHASNVNVSLDVGLTAEETEVGTQIFISESPPERESTISFTVELFGLLEERDIAEIDYEDILGPTVDDEIPTRESGTGSQPEGSDQPESDDDGESGDNSGVSAGQPIGPGPIESPLVMRTFLSDRIQHQIST